MAELKITSLISLHLFEFYCRFFKDELQTNEFRKHTHTKKKSFDILKLRNQSSFTFLIEKLVTLKY